jgi:lipopolysaccharide/colanic/teichoic acid biosynthesis glycosyltransferase
MIDFVAALTGLILICPVMLCIAVVIKLGGRGSVFYRQERLGKNAKIFKLYKFRTMVPGAINIGAGLSTGEKDPRITPVGAFLRKCSLDELPQLFNVLKGDISLVGPRPTVPQHLEYYGDFEHRRLEMRPGVTGLAMVRGRASIPWSMRIKYDVEYVNNFSLWLDVKIVLKTMLVVLQREGTYYNYEKNGPAFDLVKPSDDNKRTADTL